MTKNEAVQVNLIYLIIKLVHFLVDTSDIIYINISVMFLRFNTSENTLNVRCKM